MDIFGVVRVTWLPRAGPSEPGPPNAPVEPPDTPVEPPDAPVEPPDAPVGPDVVRELIGLADDLLALTAKAPDSAPSPRAFGILQRRVDRLLDNCGVRILRDDGPVVAARHQVIETRPAGTNDTAGWIAATIRRGYLYGDQLIRPQLVVAYAAGPPAETEEGIDHEG